VREARLVARKAGRRLSIASAYPDKSCSRQGISQTEWLPISAVEYAAGLDTRDYSPSFRQLKTLTRFRSLIEEWTKLSIEQCRLLIRSRRSSQGTQQCYALHHEAATTSRSHRILIVKVLLPDLFFSPSDISLEQTHAVALASGHSTRWSIGFNEIAFFVRTGIAITIAAAQVTFPCSPRAMSSSPGRYSTTSLLTNNSR
jgi:hypothetical protein